MNTVLLIYPFFLPGRDRSIFRFPPLGIAYLASRLRAAGYAVRLLDCTFLSRTGALKEARAAKADIVGIYCMVTMLEDCLWFASQLREEAQWLVAGGPLPSCDPSPFLSQFDYVVLGEGEETLVELLAALRGGSDIGAIPGLAYREKGDAPGAATGQIVATADRPFIRPLDSIPFPARDFLPNDAYIHYGKKKYGYSISTVLTTRGCPYQCDFCSNVIFGGSYRERSAKNVVDEIEETLSLGYERISFADDVFTLNSRRVGEICAEIHRRNLQFQWECLGRVDAMQTSMAVEMKRAGCTRIYFGIESGSDQVLQLMNKRITTRQAAAAVESAHGAGLEVGAFFILYYPGETDETVIQTLKFAAELPLDYIGLSMPYPLPGTPLYERVKSRLKREWRPGEHIFGSHVLTYTAEVSEAKMWFAILKGHLQFKLRRGKGWPGRLAANLIEKPSIALLKFLR